MNASQAQSHLIKTGASSIGDTERLAGINTFDPAERLSLWKPFQHLPSDRNGQPTDPQCAAVMLECRKRIARAVNAGLLCLVNTRRNFSQPNQQTDGMRAIQS